VQGRNQLMFLGQTKSF